ncbi:MAG: NAD(P)/FAD-dependent oxidoreductase [Deltaproteobacteria bacterium]|nr:MAG: NAD(P)/FAD-dependent oxidoreductase [Deltaproteobacteria bacterium]
MTVDPYPEPGPPEATRQRARQPLPEAVDVAIIGTGMGGLTAGAYLATRGLRVACFDGHYVAGGSATVFSRGGRDARYHFDIGLHYVGDCGPGGGIPSILAGVGIELDFVPLDPDGFDTLVFPDLEVRVPSDLDLYRQRLLDLFPAERRGVDRYLSLVRAVREVGRMLPADGRLGPRALWHILTRHRVLIPYRNATIGAFLDSCTRDPRLKAVLLGQNGDYALPPSRVSALLHAGLADHYFLGAYYPRGGGQTLADHLADTIEAHGGSVHLRQPIGRVLIEGGRAVGVETEARRHHPAQQVRARAVVSNADLIRTLNELVGREHLPSAWARRVDGFEMAGALFITCLGVEADMAAKGMGASNVWMFDDYDIDAMYAAIARDERPTARAAYITSATFKDPDNPHHAPPGVTNVEVMTMVSGDPRVWGVTGGDAPEAWSYKRNPAYLERKQAVEDALVGLLERRFPGSADHIVFRESATPLTHSRYTRATGGTSYGLACTPEQFGSGRPGYAPILPGLHVCGASTRTAHGIVGAMASGRAVAAAVQQALAAHGVAVPRASTPVPA